MKTKSRLRIISAILLIGALVLLGVLWWINGREETWLYATSVLIVLSSFFPILSGIQKEQK